MFFYLKLENNSEKLIGFISDNGKLYFAMIHVNHFLKIDCAVQFAEHVGCCQARNVTILIPYFELIQIIIKA